ncbi:type I restriction-modification enzyme R subunit C-terminal domain-containing protein [Saccharothrix deserti]|uniref:type I restriction-modification enzyme R subunit C-terminal domain-containing protein n=1 Tax=Saccharothrix deserti TaxID=2593674 RepID=UPI001EE4D4FB|nr:type I restriction-modification enzyme R subunit C-terminal domain-containing protein [Saccharothrix deserti]
MIATVVRGTGNVGRATIRAVEAHPALKPAAVLVHNPDKQAHAVQGPPTQPLWSSSSSTSRSSHWRPTPSCATGSSNCGALTIRSSTKSAWTPDVIWAAYEAIEAGRVRRSTRHTPTDLVSLMRFTIGEDEELVPYADRVRGSEPRRSASLLWAKPQDPAHNGRSVPRRQSELTLNH